jgi:hypothetical protein
MKSNATKSTKPATGTKIPLAKPVSPASGFTDRLKNMKFMQRSSDNLSTTNAEWTFGTSVPCKTTIEEDSSYLSFLDSMSTRRKFQDFTEKKAEVDTDQSERPKKKQKRFISS